MDCPQCGNSVSCYCNWCDLDVCAALESQLTEARRLLREVMDAHRDPEAWDYNDCDTDVCQWCSDAKRIVADAEKEG